MYHAIIQHTIWHRNVPNTCRLANGYNRNNCLTLLLNITQQSVYKRTSCRVFIDRKNIKQGITATYCFACSWLLAKGVSILDWHDERQASVELRQNNIDWYSIYISRLRLIDWIPGPCIDDCYNTTIQDNPLTNDYIAYIVQYSKIRVIRGLIVSFYIDYPLKPLQSYSSFFEYE